MKDKIKNTQNFLQMYCMTTISLNDWLPFNNNNNTNNNMIAERSLSKMVIKLLA